MLLRCPLEIRFVDYIHRSSLKSKEGFVYSVDQGIFVDNSKRKTTNVPFMRIDPVVVESLPEDLQIVFLHDKEWVYPNFGQYHPIK